MTNLMKQEKAIKSSNLKEEEKKYLLNSIRYERRSKEIVMSRELIESIIGENLKLQFEKKRNVWVIN